MSKVNFMVRQISQGSPSMSPLPILPQTTWTLLLPPPLPHHDSALWGQKSVCKTAGVWQKTYLFSKVLYMHLIFKLLAYQKLGCLRILRIMKSYLKLTRFTEKIEAPGEEVLCLERSVVLYLAGRSLVQVT